MWNLLCELDKSGVEYRSRCYDLMMSTEFLNGRDGVRYCDIIKPLDVQEFIMQVVYRYTTTLEKFHTDTEVGLEGESL